MNGLERGKEKKKLRSEADGGTSTLGYITRVMGGNSIKCGQKKIAHREKALCH